MTPDERLAALELKVDRILSVLEGLADVLDRWRAILPDPDSIKARLGRRKVGRAAAELLADLEH